MSQSVKPMAAAATTGILVGAAMVSTRYVARDIPSETLAFLRYAIGLLMLLAPVCIAKLAPFTRKDAIAIGVLGVFQFGVLILLINYALTALPAATCALIFSTMPLLTLGFAVMMKREQYRHRKLAGLGLAVLGIGLLLQSGASNALARSTHFSALAAVIAATVIGAICSLLYRPYLQRYPALPTSVLAMCTAVVGLCILCLATAQPLLPRLSMVQWANVIFIGFASGAGYFCLLWALGKLDASQVVAFQALGPVAAATIELSMARALPSMAFLVSMALVLAGLHLALRNNNTD